MHASLHDLLSIRDSQPVDAAAAQHVATCATCSAALRSLIDARDRLRALPELQGPDMWPQVLQRLHARERRPAPRRLGAAVAAVFLLAAPALIWMAASQWPRAAMVPQLASAPSRTADVEAPLDALVARSQELESLLRALPERSQVERVTTAGTIDSIQERIQWVDYQLSYAPADALSPAQTQRLWSERVDLMDSLVKVRYAESHRLHL